MKLLPESRYALAYPGREQFYYEKIGWMLASQSCNGFSLLAGEIPEDYWGRNAFEKLRKGTKFKWQKKKKKTALNLFIL